MNTVISTLTHSHNGDISGVICETDVLCVLKIKMGMKFALMAAHLIRELLSFHIHMEYVVL